jgi:2,4-dienoyl-CoA reductase-like NADH-dependent reductase (Old Yellow Enzyme family)
MDTKMYIFLFLLIEISYEKSLKGIFDETQLKNLKLKNRIFKGSVIDCSFIDGHIIEEGLKIYENLAKNEIGTIFTGTAVVSDYNAFQDNPEFRMDKDEYIEEYKKLTSLVHKYNTNIMIQLIHNGMNTFSKDEIIYGPSEGKLLNQDRNSVEMTKEDILRIENDFVNAAIRAKKAGFDGIEIHSGHLYLLSEFLTPKYNKRTDEYGGNDENRARMLVEIIKK